MKKIVVFGGGSGLSNLLTGLKLFPVDVTAVIAVSDDGSSTGVLKEELDIPAVGDVGKVLLAMSNVDDDFIKLLRYRFRKDGSLHNHPVRNVLLAALIDLKGNLTEATKYMCKLLNIKGTILPLTEEKVDLIGHSPNGNFLGERAVSQHAQEIEYLTYDHPIKVSNEILDKVRDADLIILSSGSLFTSIIPHLIATEVRAAIESAAAPIMYIGNLVTQPGETDNYTASDHVRMLNRYLGSRKVDMVMVNESPADAPLDPAIIAKYESENQYLVKTDKDALKKLGAMVISDDLIKINETDNIRHDELKVAYRIFSVLMKRK